MAVPKYHEMYRAFLDAIKDGKPRHMREISEIVAKIMNVSGEDRKIKIPSGMFMFENRVGWARTSLKKAGLVEALDRGIHSITKKGLEVLNENPAVFNDAYLMRFPEFKEYARPNRKSAVGETHIEDISETRTPDEAIENALQTINSELDGELMLQVVKLSPFAFEKMVIDFFSKKMGYGTYEEAGVVTGKSNDEGIDGIIKQDKLGIDLIYVQAKKWSRENSVGRPEIQKFVGAIHNRGGKGLFVTTANFSKEAVVCAKQSNITLVDGDNLVRLMREYNFGVTVRDIYEIKSLDSDLFDEYLGIS